MLELGVVCSARMEAVYTKKWVKFKRGVSGGKSMSLSPVANQESLGVH